MSHNNDNSNGSDTEEDWVKPGSSKSGAISPMELESLTKLDELDENVSDSNTNKNKNGGLNRLSASTPSNPMEGLVLYVKLLFQLYPLIMYGIIALILVLLLVAWHPWQAVENAQFARNSMTEDYSAIEDRFSERISKIDHWCLFGGNDKCYCEDPTDGQAREEVKGWTEAHKRNKLLVNTAIGKLAGAVDVVFIGDQTVQAWDGKWLHRPAPEGRRIAAYWNETFNDPAKSTFQGLALGIYGDRVSSFMFVLLCFLFFCFSFLCACVLRVFE